MSKEKTQEYINYIKKISAFQIRFDEKYQTEEAAICPYCKDILFDVSQKCCGETHGDVVYRLIHEDGYVEYLSYDRYDFRITKEFREEEAMNGK